MSSKNESFDIFDALETLRSSLSTGVGFQLGPIIKTTGTDGDEFKGDLEYVKSKPGRIEFLQHEQRNIDFTVNKMEDGSYQFFVEADSSADSRKYEEFVENRITEVQMERIRFDDLGAPQTIEFFDSLSAAAMEEPWVLEEVTRLIFRKSNDPDEAEAEAPSLGVINQAILEGQNLRNNAFVKECEEAGYRFSSMTFAYAHSEKGFFIELRVEFKLRPAIFEVNVESYHKNVMDQESGEPKREKADLDADEEYDICTKAWNMAKEIHAQLATLNE